MPFPGEPRGEQAQVPAVAVERVARQSVFQPEGVAELVEELPRIGRISFRRLTADLVERLEVIVRFLAVLELFKQGFVDLDQPERFGDIQISWIGDDEVTADAILVDAYEG